MDQERQELIDTIKLLTEAISEMSPSLTRTAKTINDFNKTIHGVDDAFDDFEDSIHEADTATKNEARQKREAAKDAKIAEQARNQAFDNSTKAAVNALTSFADTIFFGGEKGFSKFSGSLNSAGDAAFELGKSFGGLGLIIGGLIKATTAVVNLQFEQADAVFKARNDLFKFAGAGSITSNELLDMAQNIGFTSKELDLFLKPLKTLGPDLRALSDSAGQGVERFAEIGDVTDETRERFIRMGVMPEELLETQAEYIRLQRMSGLQLSSSFKTNKQLQDESLKYAENLKILSELTGEDVETLQKRAEAALNEERFQAKIASMQREAMELQDRGFTQEAQQLRDRAENMAEQVRIAAQISPEMGEMARSLVVTNGAITSLTSPLIVAGVDVQKFTKDLQEGNPQAALHLLQDVIDSTGNQIDQYGDTVGFLDDETNRQLNITKGTMELYTRFGSGTESLAATFDKLGQNIDNVGAGVGEGADPLANAQATLITAQMELAVGFDNLLQETSPLMNGFNTTTTAVTALGAAAAAAAVILGGIALKRGVGSIFGGGRSGGSDIPDIPESTGRAVSSLGTGLRGAGAGAANIALGGAAIGAAIAAIGAGIAGAAWLTGKAFPTFVEGLQSFEELNGSKLVDAAKGMTAIGAAIAAMGTGTFVGGILGGIGSLFIDDESGGTPIDKLKEFQEYDLDAPKITKNADAIIAYSNAMSALSDAPSGGVGLIEAAANGILGLFGVDQSMPWDKMVEFGNVTLPTEKIKANSEAVTAYAIAMAKLTTVNGLESFGNMAAGIFDSIGNWARGSASLPWDDMMTFAGLSIPDTLESNVEKLNAFGEAISNLPEIPTRREGGLIGTIANFFSGDVQMPWDALEDFSNVSFTEDQSANIIRNAELLGAFGEAVSKVPELPTSTTSGGKFDAIASYFSGDVQMPWDTLKAFSEVTFTEEAAEKIAENANILKIFGEALSSMPQEIKVMELDSGWFSDELLMPWDLLKTFSAETFEEAKIKENSEALKIFGEALSSIPEIEITFSEENKNNFDRLTESLDSFSKLRSDDIMKNLDALQRFQTTTSLVRAPESQVNVTPNSQIVSAISNTNENVSGPTNANINQTSVTTTSNSVDINEQLITMLSQKLDTVINILGDSVDIQDRSFRYNSV